MRLVLLLALLLAGCSGGVPTREGMSRGGIVSLNPCADQLLLSLVPPRQIAAISHYSHDPRATSLPLDVARRFRATAGTAEEVIALAPDLVIASSFTSPTTRAAFDRAGLRTLYLDSPTTIAASRAQIAEVAAAVGAADRGHALDARIARALAHSRGIGKPLPTLLFIGGDLANGDGTLLHEMMSHAGLRDAAADYGLAMTGRLPIETIVADPPALILSPDNGGRTAETRRRLLAATGAPTREAPFPRALVNCGGPTIPAALERLAAVRRSAGA
ncbi:ABC transporter substrate-binding protein [Sphingomonas sp.]|jgi:iron complex transport system substrate-binding protein|uniref:ABC transporter substrate-binding protein n=1 Tax=Sphingomonas sp. TaxID=28214 RepID=UPI00260ED228|nr:ABC transporter substrate-binding protein [Sphingomonas sp.]MDF2494869.1 transporter substrate-binding protein [Sphingomonas sp.]